MSNTSLKCAATITSITINGNAYVPDGNNLISVPSADVRTLALQTPSQGTPLPMGVWLYSPPTNPAA